MKHVLWSGGWDSTFRVLYLLLDLHETVQPHYIVDPSRKSKECELFTIQQIRAETISKHPETENRFLPLIVTDRASIEPDEEITRNYHIFARRTKAGSQYDWLCRYATHFSSGPLELCLERSDYDNIFLTLDRRGDLVSVSDQGDRYFVLKEQLSRPELSIFRRIRFPVVDKTKLDMAKLSEQYGFADLMGLTWFCHNPNPDGTPCGICHPCQQAREDGLDWRVPKLTFKMWIVILRTKVAAALRKIRRGYKCQRPSQGA
ncbi:MAG TPA: 7-cyano-7-deazaguanine synthase [Candidatus Cryosericum sp.]|nr:7-cyano-7-deazaguanine synthase [Candidatus Cryosericum sp.]